MNLLDHYKDQMGLKTIPLPSKYDLEKVQLYNVGLLKELVDYLISIPDGQAAEVNFESLTSSNVSTLHHNCKVKGYKLHCLRNGPKRVLYVEKKGA